MGLDTDLNLKNCPFCGSDDIYFNDMYTEKKRGHEVRCNGCDASSGEYGQLDDAVDNWNRRVNVSDEVY